MDWIKIEYNNMPSGEVLVANFQPKTISFREKLSGYIGYNYDKKHYFCDSKNERLENCTHFVDINAHDIM